MTKNEAKILDDFLERLDDVLASAGSNDFQLPDTPENRALIRAAEEWGRGEAEEPQSFDGKLLTMDTLILGYLREKLAKEQRLR